MGLLNDAHREVKRDTQTKELYRAIGEFTVSFEYMNDAIWNCAMWRLQAAGLNDQSIAQILLAKLTADPLRELLRSLLGHMHSPNPKEEKIIANLFNRHKKITENRNDYLHGTWYIGWGNAETEDWSVAHGRKLDRNKQGANVKAFEKTAADFDALTREANALGDSFRRLSGCLNHGYSIETNFEVDDAGKVSVPEINVVTE